MKVLYIKNNSERNQAFQLRTTIVESEDGKYVKKEAITPEARTHIVRIRQSAKALSEHLTDTHLKAVDILHEDDKSITFAFIEGNSLEKKFFEAQHNPKETKRLFDAYRTLLEQGFRTTRFDHTTMVTPEMVQLFGNRDYACFDGMLCYDSFTNMDMIFSNLIEKDTTTYLIDYEWAYPISLPVEYILYRTYMLLPEKMKTLLDLEFAHEALYQKMERHFIDRYVMANGFYFQKNQYMKLNLPIAEDIAHKESHIADLERYTQSLSHENEIMQKEVAKAHQLGEDLSYARSVIDLRDKQIAFLNTLTIKRRMIQKIKKDIPDAVLTRLGFSPYTPLQIPTEVEHHSTAQSEAPVVYRYIPPVMDQEVQESLSQLTHKPKFSIIMPVYNVDPKWLDLALKSVKAQWYDNWELCIADDKSTNPKTIAYLEQIDDPRIKVTFLEENLNISGATNAALTLATGDYIVLMDNDDEITPNALYEMAKAIDETGADFLYSDEDFIDTEGVCSNPHFKPDFSPDLLLSHNYITHLTSFKHDLLKEVGNFNPEFDGAQDYDLFLRLTEKAQKIHHIPKVLYHWRMIEGSTSADSEAKPEALERGKRLLEAALERRGIDGWVENANMNHYFRVHYTIKNNPLVSIIIPFKDKPKLLDVCVNSILEKSTYQNYEVIGISNNSEETETFEMMRALEAKDPRVKFYEYNEPFNYAQINNYAVNTYANGEHVLLLNNDIEVISPDWIEAMLEHSQRQEIGCVGAKLYYPNNTIQHAGIIMGLGGYAGHSHKMYPRDNPGYFNRLMVIQNVSAVTAACLMVKKSIYQDIDGMDEVKFKVAYNDVDFCLRILEKGYYNLFTPYAQMYHHESISRGYETTPEKIARFQTEKDALYNRHTAILTQGDPYYNPNLTHDKEDFSLCAK